MRKSRFHPIVSMLSILIMLYCLTMIISFAYQNTIKTTTELPNDVKMKIYYGSPDHDILSLLKEYDVLILESAFYNKMDIQSFKNTYGYMSVTEVNVADTDFLSLLNNEDYMLDNNQNRQLSLNGDAYLTNLQSEHFREVFLQMTHKRIVKKGFTGIFLDTVDGLTMTSCEQDTLNAYEKLLYDLTYFYPELKIMQNRGFETLETSGNYIDSLLWEEFDAHRGIKNSQWLWYQSTIDQLIPYLENGLEVFAESELSVDTKRLANFNRTLQYCEDLNFHFTLTTSSEYMTW